MDDFVGKESKPSKLKIYIMNGAVVVVVIAALWLIIRLF